MTTDRIEAARLTDEELWAVHNAHCIPTKGRCRGMEYAGYAADAATAKALRIQDAQVKALVEAADRVCNTYYGNEPPSRDVLRPLEIAVTNARKAGLI